MGNVDLVQISDFNENGMIDIGDLSTMFHILKGNVNDYDNGSYVDDPRTISVGMRVTNGPKNLWLVKYYEYKFDSGEEIYLGELRINDAVYGAVQIPGYLRTEYDFFSIVCFADEGGGGYDILTGKEDVVGTTYKAIVNSKKLEEMNYHIQVTLISSLLYENINSYVEDFSGETLFSNDFEDVLNTRTTNLEDALGIDDMYANNYSSATDSTVALNNISAALKVNAVLSAMKSVVSDASDENILNALSEVLVSSASDDDASTGDASDTQIGSVDILKQIITKVVEDSSETNIENIEIEEVAAGMSDCVKYIETAIVNSDPSGNDINIEEVFVNVHKAASAVEETINDPSLSLIHI